MSIKVVFPFVPSQLCWHFSAIKCRCSPKCYPPSPDRGDRCSFFLLSHTPSIVILKQMTSNVSLSQISDIQLIYLPNSFLKYPLNLMPTLTTLTKMTILCHRTPNPIIMLYFFITLNILNNSITVYFLYSTVFPPVIECKHKESRDFICFVSNVYQMPQKSSWHTTVPQKYSLNI